MRFQDIASIANLAEKDFIFGIGKGVKILRVLVFIIGNIATSAGGAYVRLYTHKIVAVEKQASAIWMIKALGDFGAGAFEFKPNIIYDCRDDELFSTDGFVNVRIQNVFGNSIEANVVVITDRG